MGLKKSIFGVLFYNATYLEWKCCNNYSLYHFYYDDKLESSG